MVHVLMKLNTRFFFCILQVAPFLSYASRNVGDRQIAEIPEVFAVARKLKELSTAYEKMGEKLAAMHKVEQKFVNGNNYSYPTIPSLTQSNIARPSDSEPPLTFPISPVVRSIRPQYVECHVAERSRIKSSKALNNIIYVCTVTYNS